MPVAPSITITFDRDTVFNNRGSSSDQASFTPLRHISFDGLNEGQSVVNTVNDPGSVAGKRWDSVLGNKGFSNGYGVRATTSVKQPGKTSSCKMTIKQGSDGDPSGGDTGALYGAWGGKLNLLAGEEVIQGGALWFGLKVYIPASFDFYANVGFLKTFRISQSNGSARLDYHALNGGWDGSAVNNLQIGWNFGNEIDPSEQVETAAKTNRIMSRDKWVWVECYSLAHSDPDQARRILWVDGHFTQSLIGNVKSWVDQAGALQSEELPSGHKTLPTPTDTFVDMMWCTYFNGNSPIDNTIYVDDICYTNSSRPPKMTDAYGNIMMGPQL